MKNDGVTCKGSVTNGGVVASNGAVASSDAVMKKSTRRTLVFGSIAALLVIAAAYLLTNAGGSIVKKALDGDESLVEEVIEAIDRDDLIEQGRESANAIPRLSGTLGEVQRLLDSEQGLEPLAASEEGALSYWSDVSVSETGRLIDRALGRGDWLPEEGSSDIVISYYREETDTFVLVLLYGDEFGCSAVIQVPVSKG